MSRNEMASFKAMQTLKNGVLAEYAAMQPSRFRRRRLGVNSMGGSADSHLENEAAYFHMMEHVRAMDRDDAFVGPLADLAVEQTVQTGFNFDPDTGSTDLNKYLADFWWDWSTDPDACDLAGELTYADYSSLGYRHEILDGDFISTVTNEGSLESFEGDRLRTPSYARDRNIVLGIELDDRRRRLRYYFTKNAKARGRLKLNEFNPIETRDENGFRQLMHLYDPTRVSQTRGITALHAVFDYLGMIEDTNFALLIKQQIAACIGLFIEQAQAGAELGNPDGLKLGEQTQVKANGGVSTDTLEAMSPGLVVRGKPGQKLTNIGQQVTSTETLDHIRFLLQIIGLHLGLPIGMVLRDGKDGGNFSQWRGIHDQAKLGFRFNQERMIARLHRPNWKAKVRQWLAEDRRGIKKYLRDEVDPFYCRITGPRWPYIEPYKDAMAKSHKVHNGLSNLRRELAEDNIDHDELFAESIRDRARVIRRAIKAAQKLTKETGETVSWRDILPLETPSSTLAAQKMLADAQQDESNSDRSKK